MAPSFPGPAHPGRRRPGTVRRDRADFRFEPYDAFEAPERTAWWFRLWTGNREADGAEFRFFARTGAGDFAGFWPVRPGEPVAAQPVVVFGCEGQSAWSHGIWASCCGCSPPDTVRPGHCGRTRTPSRRRHDAMRATAQRYAPDPGLAPGQIAAAAPREFPGLSDLIGGLWR